MSKAWYPVIDYGKCMELHLLHWVQLLLHESDEYGKSRMILKNYVAL
jgi:hypothetical protein